MFIPACVMKDDMKDFPYIQIYAYMYMYIYVYISMQWDAETDDDTCTQIHTNITGAEPRTWGIYTPTYRSWCVNAPCTHVQTDM